MTKTNEKPGYDIQRIELHFRAQHPLPAGDLVCGDPGSGDGVFQCVYISAPVTGRVLDCFGATECNH